MDMISIHFKLDDDQTNITLNLKSDRYTLHVHGHGWLIVSVACNFLDLASVFRIELKLDGKHSLRKVNYSEDISNHIYTCMHFLLTKNFYA